MWIKYCAVNVGIKKYKSIIKKRKMKHYKLVFLAKSKWNRTKVLFSKDLIDRNISHDQFVSINNMLKVYDDMKEKINNLKTS